MAKILILSDFCFNEYLLILNNKNSSRLRFFDIKIPLLIWYFLIKMIEYFCCIKKTYYKESYERKT